MGKVSTFDSQRKKRRRQKALKRTTLLMVVLVLTLAAVLVCNTLYHMDVSSRAVNFVSSLRPGGGFPVSVDSSDVIELLPLEEDVAVVSRTKTELYNSRGARLTSWFNSYVNSVTLAAGGKLLTYDLGGKSYRVDNKYEKLIEQKLSGSIQTAALSSSGVYALAEQRKNQASQITVYSARGEEMYYWNTSECQIYLLALNQAGNRFTAAGATVIEGRIMGQLHFHALSSDQEVAAVEIPDEMILSVVYNKDGNVQVITDRSVRLYDAAGKEIAMAEYRGTLARFVNAPEGMVYLATGDERSAAGETVTAYHAGKNLAAQKSYTTSRHIITMQYDGNRLLILTDSSLYLANSSLSQVKDRRRTDLSAVCGVNGSIYGVTSEGLVKEHL